MPVALRRLPAAVAEIIAAAEWYDDQREGLGNEFVAEVDAVIRSLAKTALIYSVRYADVRCARLKRFKPYGVFYYLWQEEVICSAFFTRVAARKSSADDEKNLVDCPANADSHKKPVNHCAIGRPAVCCFHSVAPACALC